MKRIILLGIVISSSLTAMSQTVLPTYATNPYPKTISVSGTAMMEIVPDEIYVNIHLQEYQKKGESKKDLETIKSSFLQSCKAAGIPDSAVSIASYSGNADYYSSRKKKKDPELKAGISYQVKFNNSKQMDDLVQKLDDGATQSFQITNVSHSRIIEFRKQLKIKAVQAAKDKGIYLTEAIGEKLGDAITIVEPAEWEFLGLENNRMAQINGYFSNISDSNAGGVPAIDFKKLNLKFNVTILFALK